MHVFSSKSLKDALQCIFCQTEKPNDRPLNVSAFERKTLIIPIKFQSQSIHQKAVAKGDELEESLGIPNDHPEQEDEFLSLVYVAMNRGGLGGRARTEARRTLGARNSA
jgi:hypothetical protein